jgi:hypothetical protein
MRICSPALLLGAAAAFTLSPISASALSVEIPEHDWSFFVQGRQFGLEGFDGWSILHFGTKSCRIPLGAPPALAIATLSAAGIALVLLLSTTRRGTRRNGHPEQVGGG